MTELETALLARVKDLEQEIKELNLLQGVQHIKSALDTHITRLECEKRLARDNERVLLYKVTHPNAGVREVAGAVGMGKTKVAELIQELKQEGKL